MPPHAALFDFDGTLADSFAPITASVNHTRGHYGLPPLPGGSVRRSVGLGLDQLMRDLVPGPLAAEAVGVYRAHHETVFLDQTVLLPGVRETLAVLHDRGLPMGVCSNKRVEFTTRLVGRLGVADYFRAVLGPEDVGVPKPDPAMLLEGCRRLGIRPTHAVYVGDMAVDVVTARAAGMPVWIVPGGAGIDDPAAAGPDRMLRDFAEVGELLSGYSERGAAQGLRRWAIDGSPEAG